MTPMVRSILLFAIPTIGGVVLWVQRFRYMELTEPQFAVHFWKEYTALLVATLAVAFWPGGNR